MPPQPISYEQYLRIQDQQIKNSFIYNDFIFVAVSNNFSTENITNLLQLIIQQNLYLEVCKNWCAKIIKNCKYQYEEKFSLVIDTVFDHLLQNANAQEVYDIFNKIGIKEIKMQAHLKFLNHNFCDKDKALKDKVIESWQKCNYIGVNDHDVSELFGKINLQEDRNKLYVELVKSALNTDMTDDQILNSNIDSFKIKDRINYDHQSQDYPKEIGKIVIGSLRLGCGILGPILFTSLVLESIVLVIPIPFLIMCGAACLGHGAYVLPGKIKNYMNDKKSGQEYKNQIKEKLQDLYTNYIKLGEPQDTSEQNLLKTSDQGVSEEEHQQFIDPHQRDCSGKDPSLQEI